MDWSKYPNFSPDEFRCQHCVTAQCGSNDLVISEQLMDVMQSIRRVMSAYLEKMRMIC